MSQEQNQIEEEEDDSPSTGWLGAAIRRRL
jgi:hypothetical protein